MTLPISSIPGALAALAALTLSSPAWASPGNGIRLGGGEGRVHPYVELQLGWDSNAQYRASEREAAMILHVRPGLTLTAPGDRLALEGEVQLDWEQFLSGEDTNGLSNLFADASLGVGVNRKGVLGLELRDRFERSPSTASLTFSSAVISDRNVLDVAVPWRPGGGALAVTALGSWALESFDPYGDCAPGADPNASCGTEEELSGLGYDDLRGGLEAKWRFLPRTALVVDGGYQSRLPNDEERSQKVEGWRASAGFQGLVTPHLAATLKGGYGSASGAATDLGTWLAGVELEWLPTVTTSAKLGYVHNWGTDPGSIYGLFSTHRVYADAKVLLAGRFTAAIRGQLASMDYEAEAAGTSTVVDVQPSLDYAFARWGLVGVGYQFQSRDADVAPIYDPYAFDYSRNALWLRVRGTY